MRIVLFFLSSLLISFMLFFKIYFFLAENGINYNYIGAVEIVIYLCLFFIGIFSFTKEKNQIEKQLRFKFSSIQKIFLFFLTLIIFISISGTIYKESLDWDAIALYDARAKFFADGIQFSKMNELTKFDYKNSYYYSLYPPFTSLVHFFWHSISETISWLPPVSFLYSLFLILFSLGLFLFFSSLLGVSWALLSVFAVVGGKEIFQTSLVAYSNLPYTLYLCFGILFLHKYLIEKKNWLLSFGVLLISSSQWIRFLEPSWLIVLIAFFVVNLNSLRSKKTIFSVILFLTMCLSSYLSWKYFSDVLSNKPKIFSFSMISILEPIVGIYTGAAVLIFFAYLKMWGVTILTHLAAMVGYFLNFDQNKNKSADLFLITIIVLSIAMYFVGLYFTSFQFEWWTEMGGSMLRSSTYLTPLSVYLLAKKAKELFRKIT